MPIINLKSAWIVNETTPELKIELNVNKVTSLNENTLLLIKN